MKALSSNRTQLASLVYFEIYSIDAKKVDCKNGFLV
jgi:hypothetical protein